MTNALNKETIALTGGLLLNDLSDKHFPDIASYENIKTIDLQQLTNIDSAGIAYLAQIKSRYTGLAFVGISDKILTLANLYGVTFLFKSKGVQ